MQFWDCDDRREGVSTETSANGTMAVLLAEMGGHENV